MDNEDKKYRLIAMNDCGAHVCYYGDTIKELRKKFSDNFITKGFTIMIYDNQTGLLMKKTVVRRK